MCLHNVRTAPKFDAKKLSGIKALTLGFFGLECFVKVVLLNGGTRAFFHPQKIRPIAKSGLKLWYHRQLFLHLSQATRYLARNLKSSPCQLYNEKSKLNESVQARPAAS